MATIGNIVRDVRINIDEIALNDADFESRDENELDTIIKSKIGEGIMFVHGNADVNLMDSSTISIGTSFSHETASSGYESVSVTNALRVVWAKLASWRWAVSEIVDYANQDEVACISDPISGANYERPGVVQKKQGDTITLQMYKPKGGANEECEVGYVAAISNTDLSSAADSTSITVDGKLYRAVINYISGLVLITLGDKARAQEFIELAVSECGIKPTNQIDNKQ